MILLVFYMLDFWVWCFRCNTYFLRYFKGAVIANELEAEQFAELRTIESPQPPTTVPPKDAHKPAAVRPDAEGIARAYYCLVTVVLSKTARDASLDAYQFYLFPTISVSYENCF